ncbi:MAG: lipid-A-disaccharide synthase [Planctomycetes bacterium]|nr:lipid-A-disaccharide synthase [Planctomycetota bacterium]
MPEKKLFISTGEASGDRYAAELVAKLRGLEPEIEIEGVGGALLESSGVKLFEEIVSKSVMGFIPVLKSFVYFYRLLSRTLARLRSGEFDTLLTVDNPVFNLALASRAKKLGLRTIHYVSPQVWAWRSYRVRRIKKCVDQILVLFPFEEEFYQLRGVCAKYVGHPLFSYLDGVKAADDLESLLDTDERTIALFPGSRRQEVSNLLPAMLDAARKLREFGNFRFVIPAASKELLELIAETVPATGLDVSVIEGRAHEIMSLADFAIVKSGTTTLELMHFGVPMVVTYRVNPALASILRSVVNVKHFAMVNLLAGRELVPEVLLTSDSSDVIVARIKDLIFNKMRRDDVLAGYEKIKAMMRISDPSLRAATAVYEMKYEMRPSERQRAVATKMSARIDATSI